MKRTIIASILGVAAFAAVNSSRGQGSILFVNYGSSGGSSYSAPVTFGGLVVGSDFSAELYYSSTGTPGSFTALPSSITAFAGTGLGDTADGGGLFTVTGQSIAAYGDPATPVAEYFEIYAFNNDVFQTHAIGSINGYSGVVQVNSLADEANLGLPGDLFTDNANVVAPGLQAWSVIVATPEPATLALVGLGLASLVAFRRKQS